MAALKDAIRGDVGVLLTCDPPMKQYILYLNEKERPQFVIADLDPTHLVIRDDFVEKVKEKVARYIEEQNVDLSEGNDAAALVTVGSWYLDQPDTLGRHCLGISS